MKLTLLHTFLLLLFTPNSVFAEYLDVYKLVKNIPEMVEYPHKLVPDEDCSLVIRSDSKIYLVTLTSDGLKQSEHPINTNFDDDRSLVQIGMLDSDEHKLEDLLAWFSTWSSEHDVNQYSSWDIFQEWNSLNQLGILQAMLTPGLRYVFKTYAGKNLNRDSESPDLLTSSDLIERHLFLPIPVRDGLIRLMHSESGKFLAISEGVVKLKDQRDSDSEIKIIATKDQISLQIGSKYIGVSDVGNGDCQDQITNKSMFVPIPVDLTAIAKKYTKDALENYLETTLSEDKRVGKGMTEDVFKIEYQGKSWYLKFGPNINGHVNEYRLFHQTAGNYEENKRLNVKYLPLYNAILKEEVPNAVSLSDVLNPEVFEQYPDIFDTFKKLIFSLVGLSVKFTDLHGDNILYSVDYNEWYIIDSFEQHYVDSKAELAAIYFHYFANIMKRKIKSLQREGQYSAARLLHREFESKILKPLGDLVKAKDRTLYHIFIRGVPFKVQWEDQSGEKYFWTNKFPDGTRVSKDKDDASFYFASYLFENTNLNLQLVSENGAVVGKAADQGHILDGVKFAYQMKINPFSSITFQKQNDNKYFFKTQEIFPYAVNQGFLVFDFSVEGRRSPEKFEIIPSVLKMDSGFVPLEDTVFSNFFPVRIFFKAHPSHYIRVV